MFRRELWRGTLRHQKTSKQIWWMTCRNLQQESWVKWLYDNDENLDKLKGGMKASLLTKRNHQKGDLIPYTFAQDFVSHYGTLKNMENKSRFFQLLSEKLGCNNEDIQNNMKLLKESMDTRDKLTHRHRHQLSASLTPTYKQLFDDVSKLEDGVGFLVDMRKDLLFSQRKGFVPKTLELQTFDTFLKEHLAQWFAGGFLDLHQVTWDETSADLMEKLMKYEAVHPIVNWNDLKKRAAVGRRIFMFSHRLMPGEPLVVLYVLLGNHIPNNIQNVLSSEQSVEDKEEITTATFYSISSTQRGLDGIGLGNVLIKRVVEELRREFHNMKTFVTLSPIPGFKRWLDQQIKNHKEGVSSRYGDLLESSAMEHLRDDGWVKDMKKCNQLQPVLQSLCARYLLHEKRRGFAMDPVANFHLRNGASLWRINWLANTEPRGLKSSHTLMVNYRYDLSQIETNNLKYVMGGEITASESVLEIVS
ncbi:malonyl-CoA decarboxylase, mitochondrial-like isoform X2 [Clytia hemisphaerica]|uniref:Malonyl-CoA decarboxylase n=1 Tax=Clytia hemisphaerica TaxID=252671 RepID=A0A7M5WZH2_9CNID|eukprot:TCONS_00061181-protein